MNNEIALRTSKGEYHPGDTIYGAVYLRICRPTEGSGIKITFKGTESCQYDYKSEQSRSLKSETDQVNFSDVILYSQEGCFDFGCYVFPFKFELPKEIAGTFSHVKRQDNTSWNIQVIYSIKAYILGSEGIHISQPIVIYQCQSKDYQESSTGTAKNSSFKIKLFPFRTREVHVTAKLLYNYVESGSSLQLRLVITNDSKVHVTGLCIKLMRSLKLNFRYDESHSDSLKPNMEVIRSKVVVRPEHGPYVIQNISGTSEALIVGFGSGGINNLQIPLREKLSPTEVLEVPPSVASQHIQNIYDLQISVTFSNNHVETLILNIPGVLPKKNEQWLKWKEPDWTSNCEVKTNNSSFSVPDYLLLKVQKYAD